MTNWIERILMTLIVIGMLLVLLWAWTRPVRADVPVERRLQAIDELAIRFWLQEYQPYDYLLSPQPPVFMNLQTYYQCRNWAMEQ